MHARRSRQALKQRLDAELARRMAVCHASNRRPTSTGRPATPRSRLAAQPRGAQPRGVATSGRAQRREELDIETELQWCVACG